MQEEVVVVERVVGALVDVDRVVGARVLERLLHLAAVLQRLVHRPQPLLQGGDGGTANGTGGPPDFASAVRMLEALQNRRARPPVSHLSMTLQVKGISASHRPRLVPFPERSRIS